MAVFDFPYFTVSTKYPENGQRFQFGRSWDYRVAPDSPDQRIFMLTFPAMQWVLDVNGDLDLATDPDVNLGRLDQFYRDHQLWKQFDFPHPVYGTVVCLFNKPLELPPGTPGGFGVVENIQLEFKEQP